jgi:hypothetical protein
MKASLLFVGLLLVALCGCMHTVTGQYSDSADNAYRLWISSHGASGKAYVDKSKKRVWISIEKRGGTNSIALFQQRYVLTGSDIEWKIFWGSDDTVSVAFYDWGDGVSNYENMKQLPASNHIASFAFLLDPATGKFLEKK